MLTLSLARISIGPAALNLVALMRDGKIRWYLAGITPEFHLADSR
jgi:hypothetical protein